MAKQENNTAKEILAEIKTDADSATCPGIFATLIATYCLAISVGYPDSDNQELCRIVWTGEVWELATNFMKGDLMEISAAQLVLNRMLETKWDDMQSICIGS
ncbi:MAG: hypothetical protein GY938_13190 [Ketobacter sp.]|nr:hypothetical protein [Ketobacter sp.]